MIFNSDGFCFNCIFVWKLIHFCLPVRFTVAAFLHREYALPVGSRCDPSSPASRVHVFVDFNAGQRVVCTWNKIRYYPAVQHELLLDRQYIPCYSRFVLRHAPYTYSLRLENF